MIPTRTVVPRGGTLSRGATGKWTAQPNSVKSYVGATIPADPDPTDRHDELTGGGRPRETKYLSSVRAGPKIFTGEGTLDPSEYSVKID